MDLKVGAVCEGTVTGITKFGAFVSLGEGKSGLVHISEIADTYVSDVSAFLSVGQAVRVRITAIDPDGKIRLSIKRALDRSEQSRPSPASRSPVPSPRPDQAAQTPSAEPKSDKASLDDMLKRFMSESSANLSSVSGKQRSAYEKRSARKPGRRNYDD